MEGFDHKAEHDKQDLAGAADVSSTAGSSSTGTGSKGSSVQASDFEKALDDHAHAEGSTDAVHVSLNNVTTVRNLDVAKLQKEGSFNDDIGRNGDLFVPGAGKNTVTAGADLDLINGTGGGFNTITTGTSKDSILLDNKSTNLIKDFDIKTDRLLFTSSIDPNNVIIAQGKNQTQGAVDSVNNALIIDKSDGHVLASLESVKATDLQGLETSGRKGFSLVDDRLLSTINNLGQFSTTQEGNGTLNGTQGRDKLVGGAGDDVLAGTSALGESASGGSTSGSTSGGSTSGSTSGGTSGGSTPVDDHDHTGAGASSENHVKLSDVEVVRGLDFKNLRKENSFGDDVGRRGDFLDPGAGKNTVIGSLDADLIDGTGGGFNTITTGTGKDSILLDSKSTNRILDFDVKTDRLLFTSDIDLNNVVIAQGKNPGKGGVNQPLDSVSNALIIDKSDGHILASLAFTKASDLQGFESAFRKGFSTVDDKLLSTINNLGQFSTTQEGNGKLTGTKGRDKMVGGAGDDFLYVGDDGVKFNTAKGIDEFPFPTDSKGTGELNVTLKNGVMSATGAYRDFDGLPLFSQGEKELAPNAKILNGANPQALIDGFLKVPEDAEGNKISGTHLHFSPAGDSRGNFADATVIRYFENTPTDAKSGTLKGEFELTPEEQAALLAGNLYVNVHTNIDGDGDGRAGFATGELRINLNKDVVKFV